MTLRVAVTRSLPEAEATAARLAGMGCEPVLAPLLTIERCAFNTRLDGLQALLFTSANGVRAFAAASTARSLPALCVGDATAASAQEAGFTDVRSADGDVRALAALARVTLDPRGGKLLHVSGAHAAGDLAGDLRAQGFETERRVVYQARAATTLPPVFAENLDIVLFHSPRAAEAFVQLGAPRAGNLTAACLSPTVANAAGAVSWKSMIVAPAPREDALLQALPL